jgi:hypothetical protein
MPKHRNKALREFYLDAKARVVGCGFAWEIDSVRQRSLADQTPDSFLNHYIYVVLNAGMKNQVAQKMFQTLLDSHYDVSLIKHKSKAAAIRRALTECDRWWETIKNSNNIIESIGLLPWMGPITKYHLARNLGIDCVKPDRHLTRAAQSFNYDSVDEMCRVLAKEYNERIGTIDVILWRAMNLGLKP